MLLQVTTFVLLIVVIVSVTTISAIQRTHIQELSRQGSQAHRALCAFKTDLQQRVDRRAALMKGHPEGTQTTSIASLRTTQANQIATLKSLDDLTCPD